MSAVLESPVSMPASSRLPESDQLYEIVDGQRVEKHVSAYCAWIAGILTDELGAYLRENQIGKSYPEMVFILDEDLDLRRRPDVAFVSAVKWPVDRPPPATGDWTLVPDLAVEVVSPSNRYLDMQRKLREYFRYGVKEVWMVLPGARLVQVFNSPTQLREVEAGATLSSELLPGFSIAIETLLPHEAVQLPVED